MAASFSLYNQSRSTSEDDADAPPRFMMASLDVRPLYTSFPSGSPAIMVATPPMSYRPSPDPGMWRSLPPEMKLSIVDYLNGDELKSFSLLDQETHRLVIPRLFKNVNLDGHDSVIGFLAQVHFRYFAYIRSLVISFRPEKLAHTCPPPQTDLLILILNHAIMLQQLTLYLYGSPGKHLIPCFTKLANLTTLHMGNIAPESLMPLSERSVVSIAASVPRLEHLTLDGIARSLIHAPELLSTYPYIPLVIGDDDIDDHPLLGSDLCLPSLLRIPTLRKLQLLETHLGDQLWASTRPLCSLEILDLGSCGYETHEYNRMCTERIVCNVAQHCPIQSLHVNTSLEDDIFQDQHSTPLKNLRCVHLMPLLPASQVVQTLVTLSGSPVETISIECYEEDAAEMCYSLEEFLTMQLHGGKEFFYRNLRELSLHFVALDPSEPMTEHEDSLDHIKRLCKELKLIGDMPLASGVCGSPVRRDVVGRKDQT